MSTTPPDHRHGPGPDPDPDHGPDPDPDHDHGPDPDPDHDPDHGPDHDPDASTNGPGRRPVLRWLRRAYVVALVAVAVALVVSRRDDLAALLDSARYGWLAAALVLSIGQLAPSTLLWQRAVGQLGHPVRFADAATATGRSVMARYLPGGVWYAVGRGASLARATGVPARVVTAVAALEMALSLVVATALVGILLLFTDTQVPAVTLLAGVAGALAVASPPTVNAAMAWVARRRGGITPTLTWPAWGRLAGITVVHWVWSVTTFAVYLKAFPGLNLDVGVAGLAVRFLVAWIIGFLTLLAPQGAGVFETVLAALLVERGRVVVAVAAGGYRAVLLVRDLLVGGGTWALTRRPAGGDRGRGGQEAR